MHIRTSQALLDILCDIYGLDKTIIQRIVVDIRDDSAIRIYTQSMGDERLLDVDWASLRTDIVYRRNGE